MSGKTRTKSNRAGKIFPVEGKKIENSMGANWGDRLYNTEGDGGTRAAQ